MSKSNLAAVLLALSITLTACLHWARPPAGLAVALALWLLGLLLAGRGLGPLRALAVVGLTSCLVNSRAPTILVVEGLPCTTLVWLVPRLLLSSSQARRLALWACAAGGGLALHALLCFACFRAVGGEHRVRPPVSVPGLSGLLWPYYETHYREGAHLVGVFLNDNLFGVWAVALFALSLVLSRAEREPGVRGLLALGAGLLGLAALWTYSRSACLAATGVLLYLSLRWSPRVLLVLLLIPLPYLGYATWLDRLRFLHPTDAIVFPAERLEQYRRALSGLASGSCWGLGPGSGGLVDAQWAQIPLELGWAGVAAYVWLFCWMLRPTPATPLALGLRAAILALSLGGIGTDLLESPHMAMTLFGLAGVLETLRVDRVDQLAKNL